MTEKKCNTNNKNYKENPNDYECNTKTGRWIKKKKKETNIEDDEYIVHPETGKRYKKNGNKGRQIMEKMNQIKFKNVQEIPEDILNLSEKMSIKEIRNVIEKYGLNIKGKTKKELIERSKNVYKRKQKKKNSVQLEREDSFENILVQKPKKKSIDQNISITEQKKSSEGKDSDNSNFFSSKNSLTGSSDSFFAPRKKTVYTPVRDKTLFPFINTTSTSSSKANTSKQSDKKDFSLPSAFVPSDESLSSKSKKSLSSKSKESSKDDMNTEFCACESKYTNFKKSDWDVVKMPGDNHCGFHSIIYGIRSKTNSHPNIDLTKDTKDLILELRYILIQHYRHINKKKYNEILTDVMYWLEDADIKVLADYLNICFCIYDKASDMIRKRNKVRDVSVFTHVRPDNESNCTICIYLYQTENHYDIMFPKNDFRNDVILPRTLFISDDDLIEFLLEKDFQASESSSSSLKSKSSSSSQMSSLKSKSSSSSQMSSLKSKSSSSSQSQMSSLKSQSQLQQAPTKSTLSSVSNKSSQAIPKSSSQQQESEIAENAHLKVITNIKKLQRKEFIQYSHLEPKELKKIIKGTLKIQSIPPWLL